MAKRNVQFFRNKSVIGSYATHQDAITGAENKFSVIAQDPGLLDGEIVLYRYTINNSEPIHTIVGVVCEKDGNKHTFGQETNYRQQQNRKQREETQYCLDNDHRSA